MAFELRVVNCGLEVVHVHVKGSVGLREGHPAVPRKVSVAPIRAASHYGVLVFLS
jgi:hypothetical protein